MVQNVQYFRLFLTLILLVSNSLMAGEKSILVLGDSISSGYGMDYDKGWVNLLESKLINEGYNYKVINASITGDVSASGSSRIGKLLTQFNPDIVILELGGNDGLRGLGINELSKNLQSIIDASVQSGANLLLAGMKIFPNYGPQYTRAFEQVYVDLAAKNKTKLVPFILQGIGGVPSMIQADGVHPNEQAQSVIVDNVWPILVEFL